MNARYLFLYFARGIDWPVNIIAVFRSKMQGSRFFIALTFSILLNTKILYREPSLYRQCLLPKILL